MKTSTKYFKKAVMWYLHSVGTTSAFLPTGLVPRDFKKF